MNSTEIMAQMETENTESNGNSHDSPTHTSHSQTQSATQVAISNKNPKNNLFKVKRQAHYVDVFLKYIVPEEVFFIAGDFTVDKQVFQNIENNKLAPYSPLIKYRPHIQVEMGKNYIFSIVDGSQSGSIEIEGAINMLKNLQKQKAMDLSQMIDDYRQSLARTEVLVQSVQKLICKQEVRQLIIENHEQSKKLARQRMEEADKDKIFIFLYAKFDVETCTNKFHFVGANSKFSEVFTGINDMSLMRHYIQRYGFPAYNDSNGNVNVLFSKFLLQNTYDAYLGTYDEEMLPFTAVRNFIPLHQFEISPGIYVGDKFEMRELKIADTILQQLQEVRKKTNSIETYLRIDDLGYSLEAEAFISRFYKKTDKNNKQK